MVWNTGFSPAVRLPALSNLDIAAKQPVYEVYALAGGAYEVAGFRLPVQTVFDGLVKAIDEAAVDLGGLTTTEWIHDKNAHLCTRVKVRHADQPWPAPDETPLDNRRVAQRNLAPFAIDLTVDQPDPNIEWTHFMMGEARRAPKGDDRAGWHTLTVRNGLRRGFTVYLALPLRTFERYVDWRRSRGFKRADLPGRFPGGVVLQCVSSTNRLVIRPFHETRFLAAALGIEYSVASLTPGVAGRITVIQQTATVLLDASSETYSVAAAIDGGFTLEVSVISHAR